MLWIAALAALGALRAGGATGIEVYPASPAEQTVASGVHATADGKGLPLVVRRVWHADGAGDYFMEVAVARFAADGPVKIRVVSDDGALGPATLRAVGRDLPLKQDGMMVDCELPGPGHYVLRLPSMAQANGTFSLAFWVDDLRRLDEARARLRTLEVTDVTKAGLRSDPVRDQTVALQTLLDRGGTIWFPEGIYRVGTLQLSSDTTVWLAPGAVVRAVEREDGVGTEFIAINNARNVKLSGFGTFDAQSLAPRRKQNVHHVNITNSRDVVVEDLCFENSNSWAIHIRKSDGFTAQRVKILSGKDGFDPDASRDVLMEDVFVVSADDAVAVKNRFPKDPSGGTTERVTFRHSMVSTIKSALKVGTETRGPIRDVTFENCDVLDGDRGIVLYARDGGPVERVIWRNIRLFLRDWPQEAESGTALHLTIERRDGPTPVRDCRIENVTANWLHRSEFAGLPDAPLNGVTLRNIHALVSAPKKGRPALFVCRDNVDLNLEGLTIDWGEQDSNWAGVASGNGLTITDLHETGQKKPALLPDGRSAR